jgi:hypothetical protein
MYTLSDTQVDFILDDIRRHGIRMEDLQQNLLDHICILVERNLEENGDFEQYYSTVISSFYRQEMREIEDETLFLLTHKTPLIILNRNQFFGLLFAILIGPFIGYGLHTLAAPDIITLAWQGVGIEEWKATIIFSLLPLLTLLVLFLTPERLEPLIPRGSKILLGVHPFIRVLLDKTGSLQTGQ